MRGVPGRPGRSVSLAGLGKVARQHWLVCLLLAGGVVLRVLAQLAYSPALIYIDTMKYLYNAYPGADPVGYKVPLRAILAIGDLSAVTAVQHLIGLGVAVLGYLLLLRLGVWRWLAAIAVAPVLLDAYQVQIEQTIMPDVWFEALLAGAIALLLWRARVAGAAVPRLRAIGAAGLLLGLAATVRQVGEVLIAPALLYVVIVALPAWRERASWRRVLTAAGAMAAAFALPVVAYASGSKLITGHFGLGSTAPTISTYGRFAAAADCAALRVPAYERALCPTRAEQAYGPDWLDHDARSPLKAWVAPAGMNRWTVIAAFNRQVLAQQPQRVLGAIAWDGAKLFSLTRSSSQGGTPISRWQFQASYPVYPGWTSARADGTLVFSLPPAKAGGQSVPHPLDQGYGGKPAVSRSLAVFLRDYQLGGGYAPGPMLALAGLAGLIEAILAAARRLPPERRALAPSCLLFFSTGVAVLIVSDVFQFSWRYQLPALVTLPPAGALGITAIAGYLARRLAGQLADPASEELPGFSAPAAGAAGTAESAGATGAGATETAQATEAAGAA